MTRFFHNRPAGQGMLARALATMGALIWAQSAMALDPLALPTSAREMLSDVSTLDSYALPVDGFADGMVPSDVLEGQVTRIVWKLGGSSVSTLQVLAPLRDQIAAQGYRTVFECADRACGGFDFRFGTEVVAEPEMHVDLGDFRFLSAKGANDALSILVSRAADAAYVQLIHVGPATAKPADIPATLSTKLAQPGEAAEQSAFAETLLSSGLAVLDDLSFKTGSADLDDGDYRSLAALAGFLIDHPNTTVLLVGHTDAEGSLEGNIELSKKRAASVMTRLVDDYMIPAERVQTDGVGFLSPRSSNQTEEGRKLNRRVEAVLTSIN